MQDTAGNAPLSCSSAVSGSACIVGADRRLQLLTEVRDGAEYPVPVRNERQFHRVVEIHLARGHDALRNKIIQVLFTVPGERVNQPAYGCGLFNLVFEPNSPMLAAAVEFTVGQALTRWLGNEIVVEDVEATIGAELVTVEIVYALRQEQSRQSVRIQFR